MAEAEERITVIHGSSKYEISLGDSTHLGSKKLRDLAKAVYNVSGIPAHKQKLIYRGKTISKENPETFLTSMGVNPKSKIMLIGKRVDEMEQQILQTISKCQRQSDELLQIFNDIVADVSGIEKGFLPPAKVKEALPKLTKRLKVNSESFMTVIETLDNLEMEGEFKEARGQRKSLINLINGYLTKCDHMEETLNTLSSKL